jgi:7-cyano-7-deazaguanine reductase
MAEKATGEQVESVWMIASRPCFDPLPACSFVMAKTSRKNLVVGARNAASSPPSSPQKHLDVFANPAPERDYVIEFVIPEFTCNCPLTGQPDFAQFTIRMVADKQCIELKSLKLYFWSYRNVGAFHEKVTNAILDDIVAATKPRFARIDARWNVRGGIYTNIAAEHCARGWKGRDAVVAGVAARPTTD